MPWPGFGYNSVDGLPKTHNNMRGVEGSWDKVNRSVDAVAALKDKYGFKFGINLR